MVFKASMIKPLLFVVWLSCHVIHKKHLYHIWTTSQENLFSGVCAQVWQKPACSATEASLQILDIGSIGIILSRQQTTKALIQTARMRRLICAFVVRIWHKQVFSWHGSFKHCFKAKAIWLFQVEITWVIDFLGLVKVNLTTEVASIVCGFKQKRFILWQSESVLRQPENLKKKKGKLNYSFWKWYYPKNLKIKSETIICSNHPKTWTIWAKSCENASCAICEQQRRRSACTSVQSDQHLCCSLLR